MGGGISCLGRKKREREREIYIYIYIYWRFDMIMSQSWKVNWLLNMDDVMD